jgi:hypothetical protein
MITVGDPDEQGSSARGVGEFLEKMRQGDGVERGSGRSEHVHADVELARVKRRLAGEFAPPSLIEELADRRAWCTSRDTLAASTQGVSASKRPGGSQGALSRRC